MTTTVDPRIAIAQRIMFVRNTGETESHIAFGWTNEAMCGARPVMREIGWTLGIEAQTPDHPICQNCREAYGAWMGA